MATFAELREYEQQAFLDAVHRSAEEYADSACEGYAWQDFCKCAVALAPHIHGIMRMRGSLLRTHGLHGMGNYHEATHGIRLNLDWEIQSVGDIGLTKTFFVRMLISLELFANTETEALCLMWRFLERIIESFGHEWTCGYLGQAVHQPKLLYGGATMDDVPAPEELRRNDIVETMPERYLIPSITDVALAVQ